MPQRKGTTGIPHSEIPLAQWDGKLSQGRVVVIVDFETIESAIEGAKQIKDAAIMHGDVVGGVLYVHAPTVTPIKDIPY